MLAVQVATVMSHLGQQLGNVNALLIELSLLGSSVISQDNNTDHISSPVCCVCV